MSPNDRPRVLIEDWLPIAELGVESVRERAALHSLPPLSFLHVWWARRPLVASAAVVLAGLLPAWSQNLADTYPEAFEVQTEKAYQGWLLHLVGIWGDAITAQRIADAARLSGIKNTTNPFGYKQAYRNAIPRSDIALLHRILVDVWGELPLVSDPTAGGGSIPFAAARLGIPTHANDLNGVAASVIRAGVEYPARYGTELSGELKTWGSLLVQRVEERVRQYFPASPGEVVTNYIWANTVRCPRSGRVVPLLKNKWLSKERGKEVAVVLQTESDGQPLAQPLFHVVQGDAVDHHDADHGFVARGVGVSPYDNLVIDGEYIKAEAQAGRMGSVLYAVVTRDSANNRVYRSPNDADHVAIAAAESELDALRDLWSAEALIPTEAIPDGLKTSEPRRYGITDWIGMVTPRQALLHGTFSDEFQKLIPEIREALGTDKADAVLFELALMQGKALNYNSRLSFWHTPRQTTGNVFSKHDFAFMWTFSEFVGCGPVGSRVGLYSWCLSQLTGPYSKIAQLFEETGKSDLEHQTRLDRSIQVTQGSAASMPSVASRSVTHLCMDPPYYDNVMYAELADFFYVWEKRTLGRLAPEFFETELSDKDNEAVANPARFAEMGKRKGELAALDYQSKMTGIFAEAHRVLRDNGVMSVMFTHKRADAWDTLGASVLDAGFTIETSWPVNTEAEHSLHQANMNSAASTIMLVCRKRTETSTQKVFLEDIASEIRNAAADAVVKFTANGIEGVDLLLSTYGPVLSVVSKHYPVYSMSAGADGSAQVVRPEAALDIAREEVVRLQRARIVGADTTIDAYTDFVLIAWSTFGAAEFPFDDARRLAIAVGGLDVKELAAAKIVTSSKGSVRLLEPSERTRRGGDDSDTGVRIDAAQFVYMNDAIDTVLHIGQVDGFGQAKAFMDRLKLMGDPRFQGAIQGLVNAVPRTKVKGEWLFPQAGLLDTLVTAYFPDIAVPVDASVVVPAMQGALFDE